VREREQNEREVKEQFLSGLVGDVGVNGRRLDGDAVVLDTSADAPEKLEGMLPVEGLGGFWDHDEGVEEIMRMTKSA